VDQNKVRGGFGGMLHGSDRTSLPVQLHVTQQALILEVTINEISDGVGTPWLIKDVQL